MTLEQLNRKLSRALEAGRFEPWDGLAGSHDARNELRSFVRRELLPVEAWDEVFIHIEAETDGRRGYPYRDDPRFVNARVTRVWVEFYPGLNSIFSNTGCLAEGF